MISTEYCRLMADYNAWMNKRLFTLCRTMEDVERKLNRGAFFGSIHGTLNHILYADLAFMSRFTGEPATVLELGADLHDDFEGLWAARSALDRRMQDWSLSLDTGWLADPLTYTSKVDGVARTVPKWVLVTHMMNHQTHHRGQITTLLSQMGLDIGTTDLPFMDRFQG